MVVADLHVHTTNSDGTLTLEALPDAARAAGLRAVAVTDHDRLHPDLSAPVVERAGLTLIHGIELRVETEAQSLDLLGYGVRETDDLRAEIDRLQSDRVERGRRIVSGLESHLGLDLDVSFEPGLGRPDIARAVAARTDHTIQSVFDELIGDGRRFYVSRDVPPFDRGRSLLADACDIVGLAHPLRYDDPEAALERAAALDAVECYYPYDRVVDTDPVESVADRHDLLRTGGSDAHDDTVGAVGLAADEWATVRDRLTGSND